MADQQRGFRGTYPSGLAPDDVRDGDWCMVLIDGKWHVEAYNEGGCCATAVPLSGIMDWVYEQSVAVFSAPTAD